MMFLRSWHSSSDCCGKSVALQRKPKRLSYPFIYKKKSHIPTNFYPEFLAENGTLLPWCSFQNYMHACFLLVDVPIVRHGCKKSAPLTYSLTNQLLIIRFSKLISGYLYYSDFDSVTTEL
jgi:hypothetical protein